MQRPQLVWLVAVHPFQRRGWARSCDLSFSNRFCRSSAVVADVDPRDEPTRTYPRCNLVGTFFQRRELSSLSLQSQSLGPIFIVGRLPLPLSPSSLLFASLGAANLFRDFRRRSRFTFHIDFTHTRAGVCVKRRSCARVHTDRGEIQVGNLIVRSRKKKRKERDRNTYDTRMKLNAFQMMTVSRALRRLCRGCFDL